MTVREEVDRYLLNTVDAYSRGSSEYYARLALAEALEALDAGNYAIGAVAVLMRGEQVDEYRAGNAMFTGLGVVDHAETRAMLRAASGVAPDDAYSIETPTALPEGLSVFGTLEPCPLCTCVMTNVGAQLSVSTVEDGELIIDDGVPTSDGAATVLGKKYKLQPLIWRTLQERQGLRFVMLNSSDGTLLRLSRRIFEETRSAIDEALALRRPI